MKNFNTMADDYHTSQSNLAAQQHRQSQQSNQADGSRQQLVDEMGQDLVYLSRDAPLDGGESTFGAATSYSQLGGSQRDGSVMNMGSDLQDEDEERAGGRARQLDSPTQLAFSGNEHEQTLDQLSPDNVDIQRQQPMQQAGLADERPTLTLKPFLVSFMVDARGGAMRGCRHSGVRVIIPPNSAQMPMRITCRYLRRERLIHPPPLMEGEACASKIMEVGPAGAKFLGPVLIEVPHFASLRGKEREIIVLRSDSGEVWREHLVEADERLVESIVRSAEASPNQLDEQRPNSDQENQSQGGAGDSKRRLTRIVTTEFPQYFAIISRIRQEVHAVGPEGSVVNSQVVPRVQAIFTEGALTKRIKIGLQPKSNKNEQQVQKSAAAAAEASSSNREQDNQLEQVGGEPVHEPDGSQTPALDSLAESQGRAVSPSSSQQQQPARPGSAAAKRRSRFLACFGASKGSADMLASEESSAGGDSPSQARTLCHEKPVQRRHILADVVDSDGDTRGSPSPSSLSGERSSSSRRIVAELELVPDDYYIEKEPALILNEEPKTYGKRLASSSAQTDNKLNSNGYLSIETRKSGKKSRGLLRGAKKRRNKTQLTIRCDSQSSQRPKSALGSELADSSLSTVAGDTAEMSNRNGDDASSIIQDVVTSDDQKRRTCTIQTDSDSVIVNYVTISAADEQKAAAATATTTTTTTTADDGYVSGSGDIARQSKGLFGLAATFGAADKAETEQKQKTKKKKRRAAEEEEEQQVSLGSGGEQASRSSSPTSKELKQRLKLERREKLKREKEAKRREKELEEAAIKAEKSRRKQEKEAKKFASKCASKEQQTAQSNSSPATPQPESCADKQDSVRPTSVKFANTLTETSELKEDAAQIWPSRQLDSIERVAEEANSSYGRQKELLSQEDGHDMVEMSISVDKFAGSERPTERLSSQEETSKRSETQGELAGDEQQAAESRSLKPILKQHSTGEEASAELTISEERRLASVASQLVEEATEEAVREADRLKQAEQSGQKQQQQQQQQQQQEQVLSKKELAKQAKAEERRLASETKRAAKEAQSAKRAAELEAKKLAKEAKLAAERLAKEAKLAEERLAKEASRRLKAERKAKSGEERATTAAPLDPTTSPQIEISRSVVEEETSERSAAVVAADGRAPTGESGGETKRKRVNKKRRPSLSPKSGSTAELASSSANKSSGFLARLFGKRPKTKSSCERSSEHGEPLAAEPLVQDARPKAEKPLIVSEMYPSNPDDADGEMILEVNVPNNLLGNGRIGESVAAATGTGGPILVGEPASSQLSDTAASPTIGATLDENTLTSDELGQSCPARQLLQQSEPEAPPVAGAADCSLDDQATLVNISQMVTSELEEDEDATENGISQVNELAHELAEQEQAAAPGDLLNSAERGSVELVKQEVASVEKEEDESQQGQQARKGDELREAKKRKELEVKLEREARKRAAEEEKSRKKLEKEAQLRAKKAKKLAESEAKRVAKEEKIRLAKEAKEAKRLAALAKKQLKKDKAKGKVAGDSIATSTAATAAAATASESGPSEGAAGAEEQVEQIQAQIESELIETSNMHPVETETEVQRIVEEVLGDDGVVTKTTKTIETKYVTLRQEEVLTSERRDMPIEEYERAKRTGSMDAIAANEPEQLAQQVAASPLAGEPAETHAELEEIRATPSFFGPNSPITEESEGSAKKALKKRINLNQKLIARAYKLAKKEAGRAKKSKRLAESEIAVCDEAARRANKQLKRALKESKRAAKRAAKEHKKMDKMDKKLAKRQRKIEKLQRKLDKRAAKLAKKAAKKRDKEAKMLERKASQRSTSGSRKSIKLEDIGEPVLRSSSRMSLGQTEAIANAMVSNSSKTVIFKTPSSDATAAAAVVAGEELQVEVLHDSNPVAESEGQDSHQAPILAAAVEPDPRSIEPAEAESAPAGGHLGGQAEEETSGELRKGSISEDEEIDVLNELPVIKGRNQPEPAN